MQHIFSLKINFYVFTDGVSSETTELTYEEKLADLEEKYELASTIKSPGENITVTCQFLQVI